MHHNHRNLIIPTYDTEVLEKALEEACNGNIQIRHRLEIRNLAISLWYDAELKKQGTTNQKHVEPIKALTNFKANLQRRKKTSDILTSSRLIEIPEPANTILHADIANTFRDEIDDYTQIDFGNDKHVELLKAAVDRSISKVANKQGRPNPPEKWVTEEVPSLRIVDDGLWQQVKSKQSQTRRTISDSGNRRETVRRPRYLLSGLLKCGACGGGFSKVSKHHYGCSTARNKATCDNMLVIRRDVLEQTVLDGLKNQLMRPEAYKAFVDEFTKEYNTRASQEEITRKNLNLELEKIQTEQKKLIEAIKAGIPGEMVKDEMLALKERQSAITEKLKVTPAPTPRLHPNLSLIYKNKVANLIDALNNDDTISEANEAIRQLIETIRLVPFNGRLKIELFGELAALLNLGMAPKNEHPLDNSKGVQVTVVAGAGFEPATFRL